MSDRRKVVIFGAYGQLGRQVSVALEQAGIWQVVPSDVDTVDITDTDAVRELLHAERPAWVANCAAFTDVAACERDPRAQRINADAVGRIARCCAALGTRLLHVSTDYVFDGHSTRPYREDDTPAPLNAYGRTKLAGEEHVRRFSQHLVVRTAWLHGPGGRNFLSRLLRKATAGLPLRVIDDQRGSPSFAGDVAAGLAALMRCAASGVCHVANAGDASWYELACAAVAVAGIDVEVVPITSGEYGSSVTRPAYSVLDTSRYMEVTGQRLRSWRDALPEFVAAHQCVSR